MSLTSSAIPNPVKLPQEYPGYLLWQLSNMWQRELAGLLKDDDLTPTQFMLLATLEIMGNRGKCERITQVRLARAIGMNPMHTSQIVRALATKQLLDRIPHPQDSRANYLQITASGRERVNQTIALVNTMDSAFFAVLGSDKEGFLKSLVRLLSGKLDFQASQVT